MKICKECKWCEPQPILKFFDWTLGISYPLSRCKHPKLVDPVTGGGGKFCSIAREFNHCKPDTMWEALL